MAWNDLKAAVAAVIKTNGTQSITGALLQSTLNSIVDQVGANATFKGMATPSTVPGTPDGPQFYLAIAKGTYPNFGGFVHTGEDLAILNFNGSSWTGAMLNSGFKKYKHGVVSRYQGDLKIDTVAHTIEVTGRVFVSRNGDFVNVPDIQPPTPWVGVSADPRAMYHILFNPTSKQFAFVLWEFFGEYPDSDWIFIGSFSNGKIALNGTCIVDGVRYFNGIEVDSIKAELNQNTAKLETILLRTDNLFDKTDYVEGYYKEDGITYQASGTYWTTNFIPVTEGEMYKRVNVGHSSYYVYAYDSNYAPVVVYNEKVFWQSTFESTPIPAGVAFVKVVFSPANIDSFMFTLSSVDTSTYIPFNVFNPDYVSTQNVSVIPTVQQGVEELGAVDNQLFDTDYSHFIFYGQSLSMGWEAHEAISTTPVPRTYMIGDRVWINQGNNGSVELNPLIASIGTSCGESPAVASAHVMRLLLDKTLPQNDVDIISTNCGEGGKSIERLSKESTNGINYYSTLFMTSINRAKTIADNNGKTISCPAIVWMQGEYNYVNLTGEGLTPGTDATNDKDSYKSLLLTLKNNMQSDIMSIYGQTKKPLFFMYQVAGSYINLETMPINMAMIEFAEENDDVILMNPTYQVPDYSGGHLSSNGYRWYGEYIAKQMYLSLLKHQNSITVQAKEFELLDSNTKILIHCQVPKAPLRFDVKTTPFVSSYGFKVKDDIGEITISSVQIIGGTSILLILPRSLSTNAYVTYGGYGRSGTGNVRDSDTWNSKYVYADETTFVAPNHTPVDENNVNYYDRKYPMWNWLVAFYHKLN